MAAVVLFLSAGATATALPEVEELELGNGIRVLHRQMTGNDVTGFSMFLIGGVRCLDERTQGLEELSLEAAMTGSETYPATEWREIMDMTLADWVATYNYDWSRYHLTCLEEDLDLLLEGFVSCLLEPELEEQAVERVRTAMLHELSQALSEPDEQIWLVTNRLFFEGHPYSLRPDGTLENLPDLSIDDIDEHLDRRVRSGNMLLVHCGPTPADELRDLLERTFGRVPAGGEDIPRLPPISPPGTGVVTEHRDVLTSYAVCKFAGPDMSSPDHPLFRIAMSVVSERLWEVLRTQHGLTYATYSGASSLLRNWGYLYVSSPSPAEACSIMAAVYREAATEPLDEEWLRGTVNEWRTIELINDESRSAQCQKLGRAEIASATGEPRTRTSMARVLVYRKSMRLPGQRSELWPNATLLQSPQVHLLGPSVYRVYRFFPGIP